MRIRETGISASLVEKASLWRENSLACDLKILKELLEFTLHLVHLLAHVEDDLDAGKINAQLAGQ